MAPTATPTAPTSATAPTTDRRRKREPISAAALAAEYTLEELFAIAIYARSVHETLAHRTIKDLAWFMDAVIFDPRTPSVGVLRRLRGKGRVSHVAAAVYDRYAARRPHSLHEWVALYIEYLATESRGNDAAVREGLQQVATNRRVGVPTIPTLPVVALDPRKEEIDHVRPGE